MMTARQLTQTHRAQQLLLRKATIAQLAKLWPLLDWAALDATYPKFALAVSHLVQQNGNTSAGLTASYLRAFRTAVGVPGEVKIAFPELLNPEKFNTVLRVSTVVPLKNAASAGTVADTAMAKARTLAEGVAAQMVLDMGRETFTNTVTADPRAGGWQRVLGGGGCDFCAFLAGRGAVYGAASADFASHPSCGCSAEPVYGGEGKSVRDYTPTNRNITDKDRERVRNWMAANPRSN